MKKYEKQILEAYLNLPPSKLLNHQFELEEDYLAGYVSRFLRGERFKNEFVPYSDDELKIIVPLIENNSENDDGKELLISKLLTELVCNIMNRHKKE
ncbi:MAG: hypothetical protein SO533_04155 [Eubacteriales bacterium]|nr:hypothetical protein [Eubacteriales bacterium]